VVAVFLYGTTNQRSVGTTIMKTIEVPIYGIDVHIDGYSGSIEASGLEDDFASPERKAAIHALLSLVLGHALAGINVAHPLYADGIELALERIAEKYRY
jgi:hypothetical protein